MPQPTEDLNKVIEHAINARIETAIAASLADSEIFGEFVTAALQEPVQLDRYDSRSKVTYLHSVVRTAIKDATKAAVQAEVAEKQEEIRALVRKGLKNQLDALADAFTNALLERAGNAYFQVEVRLPSAD